jgi:acetylornithine deacetylase/succinyl-diaminopimelate desuccinylase-like protein
MARGDQGFKVRVWGATGHIGSILENDGAITKMATMGRALLRSRAAIESAAGGRMSLQLEHWPDASKLLMEGGQGFLPTHAMADVQDRIQTAAWRGLEGYLRSMGSPADAKQALRVTYEKLHNAAFAGKADSPDMTHAIEAAKLAGLWKDGPVRGWDVSCDARIFACEYPDLPVITTGPGMLRYAHSDQEQIDMRDVVKACEFLAYFILKQTGTQ